MPLSPAGRISRIAPSATLAMAARANKLRAEGHRVFPFSVGEPDFDTPVHVREAVKQALDKGMTRYTPTRGTPELRKAICGATEKHRGFACEPDQVVVSAGAKHVLFDLAMVLFEEGDQVIIPAPCWVSYPEQVRFAGATPVLVQTIEEHDFLLDPDALGRAITPKTKAVILCSPSNPTGSAYDEARLRAVIEVVKKSDAYLIVDEIYADLVYDGFRHVSAAKIWPDWDRVIVVDGVSKTFAMTGFRIGWSITSKKIAEMLDRLQSQSTSNTTSVAQAGALAALTGPRDSVETMRSKYEARRVLMVEGLRGLPGVTCTMPHGAFYAFPNVRALLGRSFDGRVMETDKDLASYFLDHGHVAGVAGAEFEAPGYLRLSYACSEEDIRDGLAAMRGAIARLV